MAGRFFSSSWRILEPYGCAQLTSPRKGPDPARLASGVGDRARRVAGHHPDATRSNMRRQLRAAHSEHAEAPSGSGTLLSGYRPSGEAVDVVLHAESVVASRQKPSLSDINRPVDPAIRSSAVHSLHVVRIAWPVNEVGVSAMDCSVHRVGRFDKRTGCGVQCCGCWGPRFGSDLRRAVCHW